MPLIISYSGFSDGHPITVEYTICCQDDETQPVDIDGFILLPFSLDSGRFFSSSKTSWLRTSLLMDLYQLSRFRFMSNCSQEDTLFPYGRIMQKHQVLESATIVSRFLLNRSISLFLSLYQYKHSLINICV